MISALISIMLVLVSTLVAIYLIHKRGGNASKKSSAKEGNSVGDLVVEINNPSDARAKILQIDKELLAQLSDLERDRLRCKAQRVIDTAKADSPYLRKPIESVMTMLINDSDLENLWKLVEKSRLKLQEEKLTNTVEQQSGSEVKSTLDRIHKFELEKEFIVENKKVERTTEGYTENKESIPTSNIRVGAHGNVITVEPAYKGVVTITQDDEGGFIIRCSSEGIIPSTEKEYTSTDDEENIANKEKTMKMVSVLRNSFVGLPFTNEKVSDVPVKELIVEAEMDQDEEANNASFAFMVQSKEDEQEIGVAEGEDGAVNE